MINCSIKELLTYALYEDDVDIKQWFLEQIAEVLGFQSEELLHYDTETDTYADWKESKAPKGE
jgi:hypothetical protein